MSSYPKKFLSVEQLVEKVNYSVIEWPSIEGTNARSFMPIFGK